LEIPFNEIELQTNIDFFQADQRIVTDVLRLDKIHPVISGNKWFKLKKYIEEAVRLRKTTILTFGGAWSNHIIATAAACELNGLKSVGIIRGEQPTTLSYTLQQAIFHGMQLIFTSRENYKKKIIKQEIIEQEDIFIINEGGYGIPGAIGFSEIFSSIDIEPYSHICCAIGTGTMMAGIIKAAHQNQEIIGIPVLKNFTSVATEVNKLLTTAEQLKKIKFFHDYHFGGYAKSSQHLFQFMNEFYKRNKVPTDLVYTGKLFYAITDLVKNNYFGKYSRVLIIHSGGLQGNFSLPKNVLIF
jgi:1-aminocyclopropane-1-carboxylate deaminase